MKRRQFIKWAAFPGATGLILPRLSLFGIGVPHLPRWLDAERLESPLG